MKKQQQDGLLVVQTIRFKSEYESEKFPYVQFDNNTPNIEAGKLLVEFVKKYKPSYIVI